MEDNTAVHQVYELIGAMDAQQNMAYIITMANADSGGRAINDIWIKEGKKRSNWLVVTSLGVSRYLSAVKYAQLVLGNSSSGIVEAPSIGTPTINIGDRQKGRMMAESVLCCEPEKSEIIMAMQKALTMDFQEKAKHIKSPFGDGTTSKQIIDKILDYLNNNEKTNEKHFYDIDFLL
jgi:GDP/UDP-N,N'-diacetylbacillosamine 2-epimerase (hydrolysing)